MVSGFGGLVATIILEPRLEVISNLNRLQQQKLRRQVKIQVNEKKKQMRNVISNQVNQMTSKARTKAGVAPQANNHHARSKSANVGGQTIGQKKITMNQQLQAARAEQELHEQSGIP